MPVRRSGREDREGPGPAATKVPPLNARSADRETPASSSGDEPTPRTAAGGLAETVLETVRAVVEELSPGTSRSVALDSLLDRDLGLDSLALVELLERLERATGVVLPDEVLTQV